MYKDSLVIPRWKRIMRKSFAVVAAFTMIFNFGMTSALLVPHTAQAAGQPSANLDQCRNGTAASPNDCLDLGGGTGWVNGNAGSSTAHYVEGMSVPYRNIMEDLPLNTEVTIVLEYDIKHSGAHAIDYLTSYDRLEDHSVFGHSAESVGPTDGTGVTGPESTFAIPAPSSTGSPMAGQPTDSFNNLPASETEMSLWGGTITDIQYVAQGDLNDSNSSSSVAVTFTTTSETAVLAWGGHIGSRLDWGLGNSAGGISGSPYHMRLIDWNLNNLGNQDRSLSAAAVIPAPIPGIEKAASPLGATDRGQEILYTITYGNTGNAPTTFDLIDNWSFGSDTVATYVAASATDAYGAVAPVVDVGNKTITWPSVTVPAYTAGLTVSYKLITHTTNANEGTFHIYNDARLEGDEILYADQTDNWVSYECNFELVKSGPATATVGSEYTYILSYDNNGTANCTGGGVKITDYIPDGTEYVSHNATPAAGSSAFDANTNRVWWNLGTVTPGESGEVTLTVKVLDRPAECGKWTIENKGLFTSNEMSGHSNWVYTDIEKECEGELTVIKHVINKLGTSAVASDWTMNINPGNITFDGSEAGVTNKLAEGSFTVTETSGHPDYTLTYSGDCDTNGDVSIAHGDSKTCTLTNERDTGSIEVHKAYDYNGDGIVDETDPSNWTWNLDGVETGITAGATRTLLTNVNYTASENALLDYNSSWICDNGLSGSGVVTDNISVQKGEHVICTFNNVRKVGDLIVKKHVINDDGGNAVASDFTLYVKEQGANVTGSPFNGSETGTPFTLLTGEYTISEDALSGYTNTSIVCDGKVTDKVTIEDGKTKVCIITNDDKAPKITLIKSVTNDNGGNALPNDFKLTIGGNAATSGTTYTVEANKAYALDETQLAGYSFVSLTGDAKCPAVLGGTVTLDEGEEVTCTITNDDKAPKITLIKKVINDNGGNAGVNDFGLTIGGVAVNSNQTLTVKANTAYKLNEAGLTGYSFVSLTGDTKCPAVLNGEVTLDEGEHVTCTITNDDKAPKITLIKSVTNDNGGNALPNDFKLTIGGAAATSGTTYTVEANKAYALDETQLAGYSFVSLTGDAKCPAVLGGTVTLDEGEEVTCTITNDDKAPKLKLIKYVVNNNGGVLVDTDFPLFLNGNQVTTGSWNTVQANLLYTATETSDPGYEASDWGGDCAKDGTITLQPGDTKVCSITNDDKVAMLTVIKKVINDDGGTAVASDFTMNVTGTKVSTPSFPGDATGTTVTLDAGSYSADEISLKGYAKTLGKDCSGTIANGEHKTCTITNDDIAPKLTVIKKVINDDGGTAVASDFTMNVTGTNVSNASFPGNATGTTVTLDQGKYNVDENFYFGYAKTLGNDCSGTIAVGETKTCTITNDDIAPELTVIKHVINDDGGTAVASNFTMNVAGTNVSDTSFAGDESGTTVTLDAGQYSVDENFYFGYAKTLGNDCSGTIAVGETKTCTITNDDIPGRIVGHKFEDIDRDTYQGQNEGGLVWTFYLRTGSETGPIVYTTTSDSSGYFEFPSVAMGTYYLTEATDANWVMTTPTQPGYFEVFVTPGFDNSQFCEIEEFEVSTFSSLTDRDGECYTFGNAEKITLELTKVNDQQIDQGGDGILETTETITYTVDWGVQGNSIATNVVLTDILPAEINLDVNSITSSVPTVTPPTWDANTRTITWDFGTQQPYASGFVTYTGTVIVPIADGTIIHNVAKISAENSDPQYMEDDSDVTVKSDPVLEIVKDVDYGHALGFANPGDTVEYTIEVTNTGTDTAYNVVITDTLPDGFLYADTLTPTRTWSIGNLVAGATSTPIVYDVIIGTTVPADDNYINTAKAVADNHGEVSDDAIVEVRIPDPKGEETKPILVIDKTVNVEFVNPGDTVTYTVVITNNGDGAALNVVLTDTLPAEFTFEDGTKTRSWSLGTMLPGVTQTVVYNVIVGMDVEPGEYLNLAIAKADNHDEVEDIEGVEVRNPRVLGDHVPLTGAGLQDFILFLASLLFIFAGVLFVREGRRSYIRN